MENSIIANRKVVAWENSAKMDKSFKGLYMCVEGSSDLSIWKKYVIKENVRIEISNGWENVLQRVKLQNNCIGIIDLDFRDIVNNIPNDVNVFLTDGHDIENMMFLSTVFYDIMAALKIKNDENLRNNILAITDEIGLVKLTSIINNLNLTFKKQTNKKSKPFDYPKYEDVLDKNAAYLGIRKLIEKILTFSNSKLKPSYIQNLISTLPKYERGKITNGHDFANIMEIYLKKKHKKQKSAEDLEEMIMSSYLSADLLKHTLVYMEIKRYGEQQQIEILQ